MDPCTVEQHLERVLAGITALTPTSHPILDALGLVCAEDVDASVALPGFDNSSMDGYAVRQADVAAAEEAQVTLPVSGEIGAGQAGPRTLAPGTAAKIMTGAPVPDGADAVVPYEWTDRGAQQVRIDRAPSVGAHIRRAGDDVAVGDRVIDSGTLLNARHIGLLASVGRAFVAARPRPRVAIVSTGTELREPGRELGPDSIYDGNSFMLAAAVRRAGGTPVRLGIVTDDPHAFVATLQQHLADVDLVVTSGGVSQGDFDVVKEALRERGVWFGPVAMQPGKPQGFGHLTDTSGRQVPILTLPGNSVSAYISFDVFAVPAIRALMGRSPLERPSRDARLTAAMTSPAGRRQYMRGRAGRDENGWYVEPVGGPGSHLIGSLADSDALLVVPEDVTMLDAGAHVRLLLLDEEF